MAKSNAKTSIDFNATLKGIYLETVSLIGTRDSAKAIKAQRDGLIGALKKAGVTAACFQNFYTDPHTFSATMRDVMGFEPAKAGKPAQAKPHTNAKLREVIKALCGFAGIAILEDATAEKGNKLKPVKAALRAIAEGVGVVFPKELPPSAEQVLAQNVLRQVTATRGIESVMSAIVGEMAEKIQATPGGVTCHFKTLAEMEDAFAGMAAELWDAMHAEKPAATK